MPKADKDIEKLIKDNPKLAEYIETLRKEKGENKPKKESSPEKSDKKKKSKKCFMLRILIILTFY